jgi:hypothetical protein
MYNKIKALGGLEMEAIMTFGNALAVSSRDAKIRHFAQVRWMSFYDRHTALQYDKDVRTYVPSRRVHRVWFYANRWNVK